MIGKTTLDTTERLGPILTCPLGNSKVRGVSYPPLRHRVKEASESYWAAHRKAVPGFILEKSRETFFDDVSAS
jgi:hypothetical protein